MLVELLPAAPALFEMANPNRPRTVSVNSSVVLSERCWQLSFTVFAMRLRMSWSWMPNKCIFRLTRKRQSAICGHNTLESNGSSGARSASNSEGQSAICGQSTYGCPQIADCRHHY